MLSSAWLWLGCKGVSWRKQGPGHGDADGGGLVCLARESGLCSASRVVALRGFCLLEHNPGNKTRGWAWRGPATHRGT